jgi:hypothetical protein
MEEEWKDIPGYEGLYQVSSFGNVKSLGNDKSRKERIMQLIKNSTNYLTVKLCKFGKYKGFQVHQLVAITFLDHKPSGHSIVINHIDNNQLNNSVNNLELVSNRYNSICHKNNPGIYLHKKSGRYVSMIYIDKKRINLGYFEDKEKALQIYQKALENVHLYDGDNKKFRKLLLFSY